MMVSGLPGMAWKSHRCSEYSMSCQKSMPAATAQATDSRGMLSAERQASMAANGSHNNGTTHLHYNSTTG
jgi:hypothetical protein